MRPAPAAIALLLAAGCASVDYGDFARRFAGGDYVGVRDDLDALVAAGGGDVHVNQLSLGMAEFAVGETRRALFDLRAARNRLDQLRESFYDGWIEAAFTDDRALDWRGADYEHVLLRATLAAVDLGAQEGDVIPYLRQMQDEQEQLREQFVTVTGEKPKRGYRMAVIGNWLLAMVQADNPTRVDDVQRQLRHVLEHQPGCQLAQAELARAERGRFAAAGHGVVHVLGMVGLAPYRVSREEQVSSEVLELARQIYNARRGRVTLPVNLLNKIKIPELRPHTGQPAAVTVAAAGAAPVRSEVITDVGTLARAEFDAMRKWVTVRAVVRRIGKLVAAEVGKEATRRPVREVDTARRPGETDQQYRERIAREREEARKREQQNQIVGIGFDLLAALWTGLEDADVRCWALLPDSFQAARLELPEGVHELAVRVVGPGRSGGAEQRVRVRVRAGRTTHVIVQAPGVAPPPSIACSDPVDPGVQSLP